MALRIYWTDFAKSELQKIFDYYVEKAGQRISRSLIEGIIAETLRLGKQPLIGQLEELLAKRKENFRYLVYKNYKIIYWINDQMKRIEIVDVFDTRQNPSKMQRV
jgi:plasmid stabilization system protein ParE